MDWISIYEIEVLPGRTESEKILYSPLARKTKIVTNDYYNEIRNWDLPPDDMVELTDYVPFDLLPRVITPEDYTLLTVLPNNRCNFACSYCYSSGCRNMEELTFDKLKKCIDFFIESKRSRPSRRNLTISYMGGGEPMLSWEIVTKSIEYAETKSNEEEGIAISFRIITNGSIIDKERIEFIKRHNIGMSVSFEVLDKIQELQRKNYKLVDDNLKLLMDAGIDTQLNITVTPHNVFLMEATYETMRNRYPSVRNAMFEPVTSQELFHSPSEMADFYSEYIRGFMNILYMAKKDGIEITSFPYLRSIFPLKRACPGELSVTAEGNITGCYCVSTPNHPLFSKTNYGKVTSSRLEFDLTRFKKLLDYNVDSKNECKRCPAKWNCGGGCFHLFHSYDKSFQNVVCDFTRHFIYEIIRFRAYDSKNS